MDVTAADILILGSSLSEGMVTEEKKKKTKIIPGTQPKAQARWPKRIRLVQAP